MIFFDTETCGFHGPIVLIQWVEDDGLINLHEVWREPIDKTLKLIEQFCKETVVGFNLAFDWFHICQTYTTLKLLEQKVGSDAHPVDHIDEYAIQEEAARFGPCLKPESALDLMLHARKGPYQVTMQRDPIKIKRIPTVIAQELIDELDSRIPLPDILFARGQKHWRVGDVTDPMGELIPDLKDLVLEFKPSSALKALAHDALGVDTEEIIQFRDISLPPKSIPRNRTEEKGWAPWALAVGKPGRWRGAWPEYGKIRVHISHWQHNELARQYASDDVRYTKMLYGYFSAIEQGLDKEKAREYAISDSEIKPLLAGDDDSVLACMVGAVRWRGFAINIDALKQLKGEAQERIKKLHFNFRSVAVCKKYLAQVMSEVELLALTYNDSISTRGILLEAVAKWMESEVCDKCMGEGEIDDNSCPDCQDGFLESNTRHPAAIRAQEILDARRADKAIGLYDKLIATGRFHASFKVIGTLSSRMSGADGLNPQGINRDKRVRECFTLADSGLVLCGGDFDGFEVVLMDAAYGDPTLRAELQDGKKIHGLAGVYFFPPMTYEEILATKGLPNEFDKYDRSKKGVFAKFYGGNAYTLSTRVGISEKQGEEADRAWDRKYKVWAKERQKTFDAFCSMRQPAGVGTKVEWHEPAEYVESMFNFKRYFTLENQICRALFQLAEAPPKHWNSYSTRVRRRDRDQSVAGSVRSALFASAFAIQAANMRAAANHRIQSSGGTLTKGLQRKLWDLQPAGVNDWLVQLMNVHDEIDAALHPSVISKSKEVVQNFIDEKRKQVPLLAIDWKSNLSNWADK